MHAASNSPGIQRWSYGDVFPAVIHVVETYDTPLPESQFNAQKPQPGYSPEQLAVRYREYVADFFGRPLAKRLIGRRFVLAYPGREDKVFDTYAAAHAEARSLVPESDDDKILFLNTGR